MRREEGDGRKKKGERGKRVRREEEGDGRKKKGEGEGGGEDEER